MTGRRPDTVIVLARPEDVHAGVVAHEIDRLGGFRVLILDAADFPYQWSIAYQAGPENRSRLRLWVGDEAIDGDAVAGVWFRRISPHRIESSANNVRAFARAEARSLFEGWLHALGDRVINPRAAENAAVHKVCQLEAAVRVGLRVPETMATNDPTAARAFAEEGERVFKTFTAAHARVMLPTRELTPDLLPELDRLRVAPAIFQERIRSRYDIRATVVDDEVFPVAIHPDGPTEEIDWRLDGERAITPCELPPAVDRKLVQLVRHLGLRFGACDLAVGGDGEHVFYEINPAGQFLFAEIQGGVPISAALARALTRGPPAAAANPAC